MYSFASGGRCGRLALALSSDQSQSYGAHTHIAFANTTHTTHDDTPPMPVYDMICQIICKPNQPTQHRRLAAAARAWQQCVGGSVPCVVVAGAAGGAGRGRGRGGGLGPRGRGEI
jgi:hypothetical protein